MRNEITLVNFNDKIPLNVSVIRFDTIFNHMHSHVQLLLILEGQCDIFIDNKQFHAMPNDMVIINPRTFHHLQSKKYCTLINVMIDPAGFGLEENEVNSLAFNMNTMQTSNTKRHDQIRYLIYSIIKYNTMENVNSIYTNRAISFSFFAQLMNDFSVKVPYEVRKKEALDTFNTIGAWLQDHYKENVSLSEIAKKFNYTISYLSRLCKAMSGKSFTELYDQLRVNYSLNDLMLTTKTIEQIAENNGFENARSYVRAFNNIYQMNPSEYRKKYFNKNSTKAIVDKKLFKKNALDKILSHYESYGTIGGKEKPKVSTRSTSVVEHINFKDEKEKLKFKGSRIIELAGAGDLFNDEAKEALMALKSQTNFEYIMIPRVLARITHILTKNEAGHWQLNFVYFDKMMKKIKDLNAKPYINFEFDNSLLKPGEFFALLLQVIEYTKANYEEQSKGMMVGLNYTRFSSEEDHKVYDKDNFFLFVDCFREFKKALPEVKIGTPIFYKNDILKDHRYFNFLKYCEKYAIDFDFVQIRYTEDKENSGLLSKDKDEMKNLIQYLKDNNGFFEDKMCFQGINFSDNETLLNDTVYASSYILKNYIDNYKDIIGFSKTSLIDRKMISAYDPNPFHGEPGLFTYNSIKKASFNAYVFMSRLQDEIIKADKNYIITASKNKIVILLNNYSHYSDLYAEKEYFEITNLNRYVCFPASTEINYAFYIENLNFSNAKVKISTISKENGSSYDKWVQMGAMKSLRENEVISLKNLSDIFYVGHEQTISNKQLKVVTKVAPLESKLIEIELSNK